MQLHEYIARYDQLHAEDQFFEVPYRKEYVLAEIGRGKKVLDVGCLGGRFSQLIRKQGNEVWGVELNAAAAEAARARGVRVRVADVEKGLPFDARSFDFVNAGEVVEFLYDTRSFFRECARVLKAGGALFVTTPNLNSLGNRYRVAMGHYLDAAGAYPEDRAGGRIRVLNVAKLRELCGQAGLEVEAIRGIPARSRGGWKSALPLGLTGRLIPGLSPLLMMKASKPVQA